jgi:hypothetical protein
VFGVLWVEADLRVTERARDKHLSVVPSGLFSSRIATQDCVLGYFPPSLRDSFARWEGLASLERGPVSWTGEVDLTTASYESALQIAASLSRDEQLRLIRELTIRATRRPVSGEETSVLALCGLGQEIWQHMDAQAYVRSERSSWKYTPDDHSLHAR